MTAPARHTQERGLPARVVRADRGRQQVAAGIVDPEDQPALFLGTLFRVGQRSAYQAAMAASSRWVARRIGRCTLQPTARSSRLTWAGWYRTPNSCSMTVATRAVVQTSPAKPYASAPRASSSGSRARCSAV